MRHDEKSQLGLAVACRARRPEANVPEGNGDVRNGVNRRGAFGAAQGRRVLGRKCAGGAGPRAISAGLDRDVVAGNASPDGGRSGPWNCDGIVRGVAGTGFRTGWNPCWRHGAWRSRCGRKRCWWRRHRWSRLVTAARRPRPDQGKSDQGKSDQGKSDQGKPEQGKPEQGKPEQAEPDLGRPARRGPRPLLLHLTLSMMRSGVSLAGSMTWKPGSPEWRHPPGSPGRDPTPPSRLRRRSWRVSRPGGSTLPSRPARPAGALAGGWRAAAGLRRARRHRPVVLFVPSLINRWTVLDLMRGHSMLRWLAERGVRPMLLDWGEPEPAFTLTDHHRRPAGARDGGGAGTGRRQGGAGRILHGRHLRHGGGGAAAGSGRWAGAAGGALGFPCRRRGAAAQAGRGPRHAGADVARRGVVPVDLLQTLFALDDPLAVAGKIPPVRPAWIRTAPRRGCSWRWRTG